MSECIGKGCTYPGCSGQHAETVNAVGQRGSMAHALQQAAIARQIASEAVSGSALIGANRAERRRKERDARRARREG